MIKLNINKLMKKYLPKMIKSMKLDYSIGSAIGIHNAKVNGKKTNMNPLNLTNKEQQLFTENIETLIKDVNSDVAKKINLLVNQSVLERWDNKMLSNKLKDLFNKDVPNHFTYKNRFDTIAQNTSFDLMSVAGNKTATRLGAEKKWIFNTMDSRTADDSMVSHSKYGSEKQAIPVNEPFTYTYKGKERSWQFGRDRVNDRGFVVYTFE